MSNFSFLYSESRSHGLSTVTSEAVAYRRIISERQNSQEDEMTSSTPHGVVSRWSTPPKFGLSPPGNSRLAKRRSLKQKLSALSLTALSSHNNDDKEINSDSNNTTPAQSPVVGMLKNQIS